jgi:hypothetical protein
MALTATMVGGGLSTKRFREEEEELEVTLA